MRGQWMAVVLLLGILLLVPVLAFAWSLDSEREHIVLEKTVRGMHHQLTYTTGHKDQARQGISGWSDAFIEQCWELAEVGDSLPERCLEAILPGSTPPAESEES